MRDYIVLDLEWNQSPAGREGAVEQLPFEIIELGAVKLDPNRSETAQFHCLVRPRVYQEIHFKISEVTHMGIEELQRRGEEFETAVRAFLDWCGEDYIFCTWGSMDLMELQRNMEYYGIPLPFEKPLFYYDIQKLYSLLYGDGKTKQALDTAVEELEIERDMPFHRALADAHYTGRIMERMDFDGIMEYCSIDYYRLPANKEEEVYLIFPGYAKYVSREFDSKEEAVGDKTVTDMACYKCRRMLRKKIRWFSQNQKVYFALGWCPEHGYMKGKIRVKRTDRGGVYVVKTLKLVDEEGALLIHQRREEARKRKNEKNRQKRLNKKNKADTTKNQLREGGGFMTIREKKEGESLFLELEGRLDTMTAPQLEEIIAHSLEGIHTLEMDFQKLQYISSAGLRVILAAQKIMNRQGTMVIRHVNETVGEVFEVTGFNDILTIK